MKFSTKLTILATLATAAIATSCNCGHNLSGQLEGLEADSLEIRAYVPIDGTLVLQDTVAVNNGKFSVKVPDSTAVAVYVLPIRKPGAEKMSMMMLYEPIIMTKGDKIKVTGSMEEPILSGKLYDVLENFTERTEIFSKIKETYSAFDNIGENDTTDYAAITKATDALFAQKDSLYRDYVAENQDKWFAPYFAVQIDDSHLAVEILASLSDENKNGVFKDWIARSTEAHNSQIRREQNQENIQPGKPAPDFSLPDINGEIKTLASFKGKYVLLDFWGTWCYWCMKGMPDMKTYYAKYSKKIEFVGIDCGDLEDKWRKAVEDEGLVWTNLYNGDDKEIVEKYAIEGFPTKILIDPNGNIVEVFVGESEDLYKKLDQLF